MILHQLQKDNWTVVGELKYSVQTGKSAVRKLFGQPAFEHIGSNPEMNRLYNKAMNNTSDLISLAALSAYDFSSIKCLADIGGGTGRLMASILQRYPRMRGLLLDFDYVVAAAQEVMSAYGVSERVEIVSGSFFEKLPGKCDAYILKNILHIFGDEEATRLLKNIREAVKPGTRIFILEMLLGKANKPAYGKMFDLQMLVGPVGARERTLEQYKSLLEDSGWYFKQKVDMVSPFSMIVGIS